jgi:hypothetical protein
MTDTARRPAQAPFSPAELILYSRDGCHLCGDARDVVRAVLADRDVPGLPSPTLVERDIATNRDWERAFHTRIPVLELRGKRLELATSPSRIRRFIEATT